MTTCPNHLVGVVISVCESCYLDQDAENSRLRTRLAALTAALAIAKEMRFYCLGVDASTQNIMAKFDAAIQNLDAAGGA